MNISVKIKLHVWRGAPEVLHAGLWAQTLLLQGP
jgi:hypothetical protein